MKFLLASFLIASVSVPALAQAPARPSVKEPPRQAAPAKRPAPAGNRQAIEKATAVEEPDPAIKLGEEELQIARTVHVGEMPCELGAKVTVSPLSREGFFLVSRGTHRFVMHPVVSRTGAIRLEDRARGALWLQLGNKSMLMNQTEGKRLADECQSPQQVQFSMEMKTRPPVNLLEPAPAAAAVAVPAVAVPAVAIPTSTPAAPTAGAAPAEIPAAQDVPQAAAPADAPAAPAAPQAAADTPVTPAAPDAPAAAPPAAPPAAPAPAQ